MKQQSTPSASGDQTLLYLWSYRSRGVTDVTSCLKSDKLALSLPLLHTPWLAVPWTQPYFLGRGMQASLKLGQRDVWCHLVALTLAVSVESQQCCPVLDPRKG